MRTRPTPQAPTQAVSGGEEGSGGPGASFRNLPLRRQRRCVTLWAEPHGYDPSRHRLYGFPPAPGIEAPGLIPVMTLKSRVAAVRPMPAGSPISYGCTAVLERDSRVAVLPVGYGDGLPRSLSNKLQVQIGDRLCPVLGRICMDMCMVDVTDLPDVAPGDVARIYGPGADPARCGSG